MEPILAALAIWLSSHTSLHVSDIPHANIVSQAAITQMAAGRHGAAPKAWWKDGQFYVADTLDPEKSIDRSILVHELVHYATNGGVEPTSLIQKAEGERLAYQIQNQYLKSIGSASRVGGLSSGYSDDDDVYVPSKSGQMCIGKCPTDAGESPETIRRRFDQAEIK